MKQEIFIKNIRKVAALINSGEIECGIIGEWDNQLSFLPRFYKDSNGKFKSPQQSSFSFYALRSAYRGLFLGINYLIAGQLASRQKLWGPAIASYYSSSFHILHSYLALNGKVIISPVFFTKASAISDADIEAMIGTYASNSNTWTFKSIRRNHKTRWNELSTIFDQKKKDIPACFNILFDYWYSGMIKEKIDQVERLVREMNGEKVGTPLTILDRRDEFLKRIAETRHISMYESFGSEPGVVANLINRDTYSDTGISRQADCFESFTIEFYFECIKLLKQVINNIRIHKRVRGFLLITIHEPWYDVPEFEMISPPELKNSLIALNEWFYKSRQVKV